MRDRQTKFFNQIFQKGRKPSSLDLVRPYVEPTEEKEKKAYYKQSKQDFLNGLTLFQRIFKKFD